MRKKIDKGEMSFIFLWVINPIVILFYQNCASGPGISTFSPPVQTQQVVHQESTRKIASDCVGKNSGDCSLPTRQ